MCRRKSFRNLKLETSQVKSKCAKVDTQLAQIERKAVEESLMSGSYDDDRANPSTLEHACKSVDKAIDSMIRILHERSITSNSSAKMQDALQSFLSIISPACLSNYSRPIQTIYAWGHWICGKMFQGIEHVSFDMDARSMTSPLDPKKHALNASKDSSRDTHAFLEIVQRKFYVSSIL